MLKALSFTSVTVQNGGAWVLRVLVADETGAPPATVPTVEITTPGGAVGPFDMDATDCTGVYRLTYFTGVIGRHTAIALHPEHGAASFVAEVVDVVDTADLPSVESCNNYMGEHSYTDEDVADALAQERDAQYRVCRVPATYPNDLRGALHRRVQRALHMRALALAVRETTDGESQVIVPGNDPEVRRLEKPWRRLPIG